MGVVKSRHETPIMPAYEVSEAGSIDISWSVNVPWPSAVCSRVGEINVICEASDCRLCGVTDVAADYKRNHCPGRTVIGIVGNRCSIASLCLRIHSAAPQVWIRLRICRPAPLIHVSTCVNGVSPQVWFPL